MKRGEGSVFRHITAAVLLAGFSLVPARSYAQSFDCKKAATAIEHRICDDKSLGDLDLSLASELKDAQVTAPYLRIAFLAGERRWIAERDKQCLTKGRGTGAAMSACLAGVYRARLADLKSGAAKDTASRFMTASCQAVADRYRGLADAHSGEPPLSVLSKSPKTGITLAPPLVGLKDPTSPNSERTRKQNLPFAVPEEVTNYVMVSPGLGNWERLPNTDFYSFSDVEGTAHCYESFYFVVKNGRAQRASVPPGFDDYEGGGSCGVSRSYGAIDNVPVYFEERYDWTPSMTSSVKIATWDMGQFAAACSVTFSYAPQFSSDTLNDWVVLGDLNKPCAGDECERLRRAAYDLVEAVQNSPADAQRHFQALLSPAQQAQYDAIERDTTNDRPSAADAQIADDLDPSEITQERPIVLPYVDEGHVYIASLGHLTIGWRYFADWGVKFEAIEDGKLVQKAAFAFGMVKGRLEHVSVTPINSKGEAAN